MREALEGLMPSRSGKAGNRGCLLAPAGLALLLLIAATPSQAGEVVEYYHLDAIGNVRAVTNAAGQVVERHDYLPFGEECTTGPCASNPGLNAGQPRKFTGKERDPETGLDYFGARYYGSKIGRFTTVDPAYVLQANLVDPQRWNKYAYARNNPLKYTDPDGRLIDTIADVGFIGWDLFDMGRSAYRGEGISGTQWLALGGDIVGAAIPFATGVGAAIRAGNKIDNALEAGRAAEHLIDAGQAAKRGEAITDPARLLAERAGPTGHISPTEVMGRTPSQIDARAGELGLSPRGPNPAQGRGAYIDPQTGQQRILSHPNAQPPHAHVNSPSGQRVGPSGSTVPRSSPEAHLPIKRE